MNHNPPPRRPSNTPQRPSPYGAGQPPRRTPSGGAPRPSRPLIHPARTARRRRQRKVVVAIFALIILLICLVIGLIFSELAVAIGTLNERTGKDKNKDRTDAVTTTAPDGTGDPTGTSDVSDPSGMAMTVLQKPSSDTAIGELLLVDRDHAYVFPSSISNIINLFDNRPYVTDANGQYVTDEDGDRIRTFKVRNSNQSLDRVAFEALCAMAADFYDEYQTGDLLVTWGYRSLKDQQDLYQLYVQDYPGYSDSQIKQQLLTQVDTPGYSEHHLGTCVDFKLYTDDGITYSLDEEPGYLSWLTEHCHRYGFILRYPTDKATLTNVGYDPHHFRYVGIPHAYYMMQNGLCLEEYLELLRTTTEARGEHLAFTADDGKSYEVYYVSADGDTTDIPVPAALPYTVSGDNMDGFIVTVTMD